MSFNNFIIVLGFLSSLFKVMFGLWKTSTAARYFACPSFPLIFLLYFAINLAWPFFVFGFQVIFVFGFQIYSFFCFFNLWLFCFLLYSHRFFFLHVQSEIVVHELEEKGMSFLFEIPNFLHSSCYD